MSAKNEVLSLEEITEKKRARIRFIVCALGAMFAICGVTYGMTAVINVNNPTFFPYLHAAIQSFIGSAILWMAQYIVDVIREK